MANPDRNGRKIRDLSRRWLLRRLGLPATTLILLAFALLSSTISLAAGPETQVEPKLSAMFPWVAQQGTTVTAEVLGQELDGARGVWFDTEGIQGGVVHVEKLHEPAPDDRGVASGGREPQPTHRITVELRIDERTLPGIYSLRIVTPRGLSNRLRFQVTRDRVEIENAAIHPDIENAEPLALPIVINGRLGKPGESDYYSFEARAGQMLAFEAFTEEKYDQVLAAKRFAPLMSLYRAGGSWFDPRRPTRILFAEAKSSDVMPLEAHGTYRFAESGRYFLEVAGLFGQGGAECSYQLRIAPAGSEMLRAAGEAGLGTEWSERSFERPLTEQWPGKLQARGAGSAGDAHPPAEAPAGALGTAGGTSVGDAKPRLTPAPKPAVSIAEREPNNRVQEAQEISIPSVVEGSIGEPGDIDSFRFKAEPGQKLAFEIETPELGPPQFNPRLGVVDAQDHELFSNVHRRVSLFNNNADRHTYLKAVEPKAVYTFERGGEYGLQVRDITSRYAGPPYRYRVLVRPQQPHIGEISVLDGDQVNLVRGKTRKLVISAAYEEGFSGEAIFSVEGLPEGVQALPATQFTDDRPPMEVDENPEIVVAKEQKTTVVLVASQSAPVSVNPVLVKLACRPVVNGELGPTLPVRMIPLMVVDDKTGTQAAQKDAGAGK